MIQSRYKPESFIEIDAPDAFSDPFSKLKLKKNFSFSKPTKEIMLCSTAAAAEILQCRRDTINNRFLHHLVAIISLLQVNLRN